MTLEEIYQSKDAFKSKLDALVKSKEASIIWEAIEKDILSKISRDPVLKPGQSYAEGVSNAHSYLQGMRDVIHTIRTIGNDKPKFEALPQEKEYEHAVAPELRPENWGKYPFEDQLKQALKKTAQG